MSEKKKIRCECEKKALLVRINRIEGQVRGIGKMIENNAYCVDLLTQISAVKSALGSLGRQILDNHIATCVVDGIKSGDNGVIAELNDLIKKYF
jgi:DNA-binding FrmR family transcriptional regulator